MSGRKAPPPKMPQTLLGLPVVMVEKMPEGCEGDIIIGSDINGSLLAVGKILAGIKEDPK